MSALARVSVGYPWGRASFGWLLAIGLMLLVGKAAQADERALSIGQVIFTVGEVTLERDGAAGPVERGMAVMIGDRLQTGSDGHVHLLMHDQGFFSVRPDSRMTIVEYRYDPADVANNRVKVELEQGVLRSVTGRAGEANKQQYRVNTPVAAIGVRGTDYTVLTSREVSRVSVRAGGVVMAPFGEGCQATAFGPCEGAAAEELFARNSGALLEARLGAARAVITHDAPSPDVINPPLPEEERAMKSLVRGTSLEQSTGNNAVVDEQTEAVSAESDPADYLSRRLYLELYIASQPLVQQAVELGGQGSGEILPSDAGLVESPSVIWGRWDHYANAGPEHQRISQLMYDNRQYAATNRVFAMMENKVTDRHLPSGGRAFFKLNSYEAYLQRGESLEKAGLSNAALIVDFDDSRFATHMRFHADSLPEAVQVVGSGKVGDSGYFSSDGGSPATINGVLTSGAGEAGMLFNYNLAPGLNATGATHWVNAASR